LFHQWFISLLLCQLKIDDLNYLAHIFLSGNRQQLQVGNFIGDFVKGSKLKNYPTEIRQGIVLHRLIDEFTDNHEVVKETVNFVRPTFGRYSGIVVDMYFDYFLGKNFQKYSPGTSLSLFAFKFYFAAILNYNFLPIRVKRFIFHLILSNRLHKYSTLKGLEASLIIMSNHKVSAIKPAKTIQFLVENHEELEQKFFQFFPYIIEFAYNQRANL